MKFKKLYRTPSASVPVVCAAMLLAGPVARSQETTEKVTVDDVDRTFMVRLPRGYDAKQHYPVVVLLHGMNQDAGHGAAYPLRRVGR